MQIKHKLKYCSLLTLVITENQVSCISKSIKSFTTRWRQHSGWVGNINFRLLIIILSSSPLSPNNWCFDETSVITTSGSAVHLLEFSSSLQLSLMCSLTFLFLLSLTYMAPCRPVIWAVSNQSAVPWRQVLKLYCLWRLTFTKSKSSHWRSPILVISTWLIPSLVDNSSTLVNMSTMPVQLTSASVLELSGIISGIVPSSPLSLHIAAKLTQMTSAQVVFLSSVLASHN